MTVFNYDKYTVAELWNNYQNTDKSQSYIKIGDLVQLADTKTLLDNNADVRTLGCADMLMTVVQECKMDNDLWLHTVVGLDGSDVILADSDIVAVYRPMED